MATFFADESIPSLVTIEDEIRAGLPMDGDRMASALANEDFYQGKNVRHLEMREGERLRDFQARPKRYSRMLRKAVRTLTSLLYAPGPARALQEPSHNESQQWLELSWKSNHLNHLMHAADIKATLNDVAAIQAVGTGREACPVKLYLWGADEFAAYFTGDDPCTPWATVTMSIMQADRKKWRRYEAWSAKEHRVYETRAVSWSEQLPTYGGTEAIFQKTLSGTNGDALNPYGCLPFTFVWNEKPVARFWGSGLGNMLRECNEDIDRELSAIAEHVDIFLNPDLYYRNVQTGTTIERKPGQPILLPPCQAAKEGSNIQPEPFFLQAKLGVQDGWWNAQKYANQTFHELDVPLSAVRDDQQGPQSGIQIEAERGPLLDYTRARQSEFSEYEEAVAKLILRVAGHYYDRPALVSASEALKLAVTWTKPASSVRSSESDAHEKNDLDIGITSRIAILMGRGMTRDEAEKHLDQVADDLELEEHLFTGDEDDDGNQAGEP